jgi:ribose transport system ATP-binding protein
VTGTLARHLEPEAATAFRLEARNIHKSFGGVEVLHGVDLEARAGSVLALLGENGAGKSTLVKIISGDYQPDDGDLVIDEEIRRSLTPIRARNLGISIIFQEFQDAPSLTVAENISLGRLPGRAGMVSWRAVRRRAKTMLNELRIDIDLGRTVDSLRVGERQVIEIARALARRARMLILDEPTSALSQQEAHVLFGFIARLRDQGVAIVYITHRLDEVTTIADRVQVLRDGKTVHLSDVRDTNRAELIEKMVGRRLADVGRPTPALSVPGTESLRWIGGASGAAFTGVDLEVRQGEVVALFGKLGSGVLEVAETGFGLRQLTGGRLELGERAVHLGGPATAIHLGIGYLPADRKDGALPNRSVAENLAMPSWSDMAKGRFFVNSSLERRQFQQWRDRLSIRCRSDRQTIGTLSGGNQQKALIARWLQKRSKILILVEPTRGVDVGARDDIYGLLRNLASQGCAVLIVTSDPEEVVQVADRAYVMAKGRVLAHVEGADVTSTRLLSAAGG